MCSRLVEVCFYSCLFLRNRNGISHPRGTNSPDLATFNGRETVLKANGFDKVTVLTTKSDLKCARAYNEFIDLLHVKLREEGVTPEDAISGLAGKFPASANFLRHTKRKLGQPKDLRNWLDQNTLFHEEEDEEDSKDDSMCCSEETRQKYWNNQVAQRVLKSIDDLMQEEQKIMCTEILICKMFNDTYQHQFSDAKVKPGVWLTHILENYKKDGLLEKICRGGGGGRSSNVLWKMTDREKVKKMINEKLVME